MHIVHKPMSPPHLPTTVKHSHRSLQSLTIKTADAMYIKELSTM